MRSAKLNVYLSVFMYHNNYLWQGLVKYLELLKFSTLHKNLS
jgi:hypothetical protein